MHPKAFVVPEAYLYVGEELKGDREILKVIARARARDSS